MAGLCERQFDERRSRHHRYAPLKIRSLGILYRTSISDYYLRAFNSPSPEELPQMNCPYCAEGIKDEAIVCPKCRRDLNFFKPIEQRLQAFDTELNALNECVTKMAACLDRHQLGEDKDDGEPTVPRVKKPTIWRMLLVVLLQFVFMIALVVISLGIEADMKPKYLSIESYPNIAEEDKPEVVNAFNEANRVQTEVYQRRDAILAKVCLAAIFALPIALGLWVGRRWQGRNLKRYLLVGFLCGAIDGVIILTFVTYIAVRFEHYPGQFLYAVLLVLADMFRCIFGFATGGLLGDWFERRKYPQLYSRGFTDLLKQKRLILGERLGIFGRMTRGMGGLTTSVAPVVPLIGVLVTSVFGYYAARGAKSAKDAGENEKKPAVSAPATNVPSPTPVPSAR